MSSERTFRADLFLSPERVLRSGCPPLRERQSDIPPLAEYFLARLRSTKSSRLKPAFLPMPIVAFAKLFIPRQCAGSWST